MKRFLSIFTALLLTTFSVNAQFSVNALHFDGVDDYITCPLPSIFESISSNDFTIEFWVNPTVGNFERLFYAQSDADNFASVSLNPTGEIVFYLNANTQNFSIQSVNTMTPLEWAHIAVNWNAATSESKIFLNGAEATYAVGVYVSSTGTDSIMTIGSRTDGNQVFSGEMDELAIWDIAMEECEINFQQNAKKSGAEPNIVASYIFDSGNPGGSNPSQLTLPELGPFSYSGNLMNFALSGTSSNWILSNANILKVWGAQSQVFLGQLGLVSTISADTYQWIYCPSGAPVPNATSSMFDPPTDDPMYTGVSDSYAVVSTQGGCVDTSLCFNFNGNLSLDENQTLEELSIYPNPSNGQFNVDLPIGSEEIKITSLSGELMFVATVEGMNEVAIDLPTLSGFYFVQVKTQSAIVSSKIIIENN